MLNSPTPAVLACSFHVPSACVSPSPGLPCWLSERQQFLHRNAHSGCWVYPDGRHVFIPFSVGLFHWLNYSFQSSQVVCIAGPASTACVCVPVLQPVGWNCPIDLVVLGEEERSGSCAAHVSSVFLGNEAESCIHKRWSLKFSMKSRLSLILSSSKITRFNTNLHLRMALSLERSLLSNFWRLLNW